jgi:FeS assembly SUF system protein
MQCKTLKMDKIKLETIIIDILKTVYDPEIPVDIYQLGLIYEVKIDEEFNVEIIMTLTSPNCPVAETMPAEVEDKVKGIKDVKSAKVEIVFEPTWDMSMISEDARLELGLI